MARVVYVHWNEEEGKPTVRALEGAGHEVLFHFAQNADAPTWKQMKEWLPEAMVISLGRLPSHGRQVVNWFWEAKSRRSVPVLFVDGEPEKVAVARKAYPQAIFTTEGRLLDQLGRSLAPSRT